MSQSGSKASLYSSKLYLSNDTLFHPGKETEQKKEGNEAKAHVMRILNGTPSLMSMLLVSFSVTILLLSSQRALEE